MKLGPFLNRVKRVVTTKRFWAEVVSKVIVGITIWFFNKVFF
jgi:hypothetical protein